MYPGWCGSVDSMLACESKGPWFDYQSGRMRGLWARSPVGDSQEAATHWCFSPSLSLSIPFCLKINKKNLLKKKWLGISFLAINGFLQGTTLLKSLPFKLFVLIFYIWMRIIPVLPEGNVFYIPSHSEEKMQHAWDDKDKFEPVENAPYVQVGMMWKGNNGKNITGKPAEIQRGRSKEHIPSLREQKVWREMDTHRWLVKCRINKERS